MWLVEALHYKAEELISPGLGGGGGGASVGLEKLTSNVSCCFYDSIKKNTLRWYSRRVDLATTVVSSYQHLVLASTCFSLSNEVQ